MGKGRRGRIRKGETEGYREGGGRGKERDRLGARGREWEGDIREKVR